MKTYMECVAEAAAKEDMTIGAVFENWYHKTHERILEAAAVTYAEQSNSHKHGVMQAGSEKQPYFKLSTNEFGKHWLFYSPLKSEPGKYGCWMPIDDEFYSEFNKLQKAALGSEAAVASGAVGSQTSAREKTPCTCANFYVGKRWCTKELNGHCG